MHVLTNSIQHSVRSPRQSSQAGKEIKGIRIRKGEEKLSLCPGDMLLYIENPKDRKFLSELINLIEFQDKESIYKDHLRFYTLTMNYLKRKLREQSYL